MESWLNKVWCVYLIFSTKRLIHFNIQSFLCVVWGKEALKGIVFTHGLYLHMPSVGTISLNVLSTSISWLSTHAYVFLGI